MSSHHLELEGVGQVKGGWSIMSGWGRYKGHRGQAHYSYLAIKVNLHKLSEPAAVVITHGLSIAKCLQQWICCKMQELE